MFAQFIYRIGLYNILQASAFTFAILLGIYNAPKCGISRARALNGSVWILISALTGTRLLFILLYPERFPTVMSWFDFKNAGQVFFGGFLGSLFAAIIYTRHYRMEMRNVVDLVAPSLGLGHFLGRLGCFAGGCCYGAVTSLPWGVVFSNRGEYVARHPTQLYEAGFLFLLFLWSLRSLNQRASLEKTAADGTKEVPEGSMPVPGRIGGIYLLAYSCFRFMVEFVRADDRGGFFTPLHLSPSQVIALGTAAVAIAWLRYCHFRKDLPRKSPTESD